MTLVLNRRADFTLDSFRRVAFGREDVEIGPAARDAIPALRGALQREFKSALVRTSMELALQKIEG